MFLHLISQYIGIAFRVWASRRDGVVAKNDYLCIYKRNDGTVLVPDAKTIRHDNESTIDNDNQ